MEVGALRQMAGWRRHREPEGDAISSVESMIVVSGVSWGRTTTCLGAGHTWVRREHHEA